MLVLRSGEKVIDWVHSKLNANQFLIFSSVLVGLTAGIAAVFLKTFVHFIHDLAIDKTDSIPIAYIFLPFVGIALTVFFVFKFLNGKLGRGTSNIIYSIVKRSGFLPKDQMYSHIITSGLTVGFGGSAGLESPIVTTGAAIGANYSKRYKLLYKERILLLACGSAAGIAAIFNSPIAGVLFALEVLLADVSISTFIPLLISAAAGTLCSKIILDEEIILSFGNIQAFDYRNVPFYIVLGLLAGLVSVYYARTFIKIETLFKNHKLKVVKRLFIGGTLLAVLIFIFPPLFGEGYESIKSLSNNNPELLLDNSFLKIFNPGKWGILAFITAIMLVKVFATAITIGSGGNGGNFAPSLFVGAYLGFAFAYCINLTGFTSLPVSNFTLVAMSGILTGVFHAPLTGIFLIAEITGGYDLMIPLMVVSAISYTVVKFYEPRSIDSTLLAKRSKILRDDKDKSILSSITTSLVIEKEFQTVMPEMTLKQLLNVLSNSKRNVFPVVDINNILVGIVSLDNIREIMFKTELYEKISVRELMRKPATTIAYNEDMHSIIKKFDQTGSWNLPVLKNDEYIGFISKSSLLSEYRDHLIKNSLS